MRVLHVVSTGQRRGGEIFASELVKSLSYRGLSQRVVVLRRGDGVAVPFEAPVDAWLSDGWRVPGLRADARSLRALRALIRGFQPDLVQAHGGEALKYVVTASHGRIPPVVYRRIGSAPPWVATGARRRAHATLMRRAARIVTIAEAIRRETIEMYGIPPDKVVTIPSGVDPRRVMPEKARGQTRRALGIPANDKVLLSLGALTREKDPLSHVEVARRVFREIPDTFHIIAGDGPLEDDVRDAVRGSGMQDRFRVLGNRSDVGDLLSATDVMLLASATEGMPGCLIEAGMAGVAVAAYAVAGVSEVVEDRATGLLAPPGDVTRLTANVLELCRNDHARIAMGEAARKRCLERFETSAIAQRYFELYEYVTNGDVDR